MKYFVLCSVTSAFGRNEAGQRPDGDDKVVSALAAIIKAVVHVQGKGKGTVARVHRVEVPDVRAIREELGRSQQAFASA